MAKLLQRFDPFTGTIIQRPVYGDNYRYAADNTLSITASDVFQTKIVLPVGVLISNAVYELDVSYKWNHSATNNDFEARILDINNNALAYLDGYHKQEPKDAGGNWEGTNSEQRHPTHERYPIIGGGVAQQYTLQYRTDSVGISSSIWDVLLTFKRVA